MSGAVDRRTHFPAPSRSTATFSGDGQAVPCCMVAARRFVPVVEWEDARQRLGLQGERIALAFLTSCGWSVEAHRYRLGRHDLDLIVRKGHTVAFVEVKTRRSVACGSGLEAVSRRKQRDIARVAMVWLLRYGRADDVYRFDLLSVQVGPGGKQIVEHVANAWQLGGLWGR